MVKTVITDNENVVYAIGDFSTFSQDANDSRIVYLNGSGYAMANQHIHHNVETPDEVTSGLYTYDGTVFAEYISERDRIAQKAIDDYTTELLEGGLL